jgi:hypothetical protein
MHCQSRAHNILSQNITPATCIRRIFFFKRTSTCMTTWNNTELFRRASTTLYVQIISLQGKFEDKTRYIQNTCKNFIHWYTRMKLEEIKAKLLLPLAVPWFNVFPRRRIFFIISFSLNEVWIWYKNYFI